MEIPQIWITDEAVHIRTADGREGKELFADYARLRGASRQALEDYTPDAFGIHWNTLNEDLCYEGFFKPKKRGGLYALFLDLPEINVSALARRLGISQSLMAQYVSGAKKPSAERAKAILEAVRDIGRRMQAATL